MSTIREFVEKWGWKGYDFDKSATDKYKFQCVDLIKLFCMEPLGIEKKDLWIFGNGKDTTKKLWEKYSFESYTPKEYPKRWDVVSFRALPKNENFWHVAIVLGVDDNGNIFYLDQNSWRWSWTWRGSDSITIRKIWEKYNSSDIVWYAKCKFINDVINKDLFDKIIFENQGYINETLWVSRKNAVQGMYFIFHWNFDGWEKIWITKELERAVLRREFAYMLRGYLKNIRWIEVSYDDLIHKYNVWSGSRPEEKLTPFELNVMLKNMKKIFG